MPFLFVTFSLGKQRESKLNRKEKVVYKYKLRLKRKVLWYLYCERKGSERDEVRDMRKRIQTVEF